MMVPGVCFQTHMCFTHCLPATRSNNLPSQYRGLRLKHFHYSAAKQRRIVRKLSSIILQKGPPQPLTVEEGPFTGRRLLEVIFYGSLQQDLNDHDPTRLSLDSLSKELLTNVLRN